MALAALQAAVPAAWLADKFCIYGRCARPSLPPVPPGSVQALAPQPPPFCCCWPGPPCLEPACCCDHSRRSVLGCTWQLSSWLEWVDCCAPLASLLFFLSTTLAIPALPHAPAFAGLPLRSSACLLASFFHAVCTYLVVPLLLTLLPPPCALQPLSPAAVSCSSASALQPPSQTPGALY